MEEREAITLTLDEQRRLRVLEQLRAGNITTDDAAAALKLSIRQVFRLQSRYATAGVGGLVHGNRGRRAQNRIRNEERIRIVTLTQDHYPDPNRSHARDLLAEREGVVVSTPTLTRILREAGVGPICQQQRRSTHRLRRDRMPQEGMLVQADGSFHRWFGEDRPHVCLLAAIDDATSKVIAAVFREREDAQGYLLLLEQIIRHDGVPLEFYHDRHSIFEQNQSREWSIAEELRGGLEPTQVTRALEQLGITSIAAHSPQAKGRIERLWRTWQDRLVHEMHLEHITDIAGGNAFLPGYLGRHNTRFAEPAADPGLAYRSPAPGIDLERILSFHLERRVANDNTARVANEYLQIPPGPWRRSYAQARVMVHLHLDGSISIWHQERQLLRNQCPGKAADSPRAEAPQAECRTSHPPALA